MTPVFFNFSGSEDRISADGGVISPPTPCAAGSAGIGGGLTGLTAGGSALSSSALSNLDHVTSSAVSSLSSMTSSSTLMNGETPTTSASGAGVGSGGLNGSLMSSIAGLANGKHHHNGDLNHMAANKANLGMKNFGC